MAAPLRVLFDLNVVLGVLQQREPHHATSARALACAETGLLDGWVAARSLTTCPIRASRIPSRWWLLPGPGRYLVTRDVRGCHVGPLAVLQAAALLALL
jgi:hypothetical protein